MLQSTQAKRDEALQVGTLQTWRSMEETAVTMVTVQ